MTAVGTSDGHQMATSSAAVGRAGADVPVSVFQEGQVARSGGAIDSRSSLAAPTSTTMSGTDSAFPIDIRSLQK